MLICDRIMIKLPLVGEPIEAKKRLKELLKSDPSLGLANIKQGTWFYKVLLGSL